MTVPAEVLLGFIEQTAANPIWLLTGEGRGTGALPTSGCFAVEPGRIDPARARRARAFARAARSWSPPRTCPSEQASDFVAVGLYPLAEIGNEVPDPSRIEGYVLAYRHWLPNPSETIATRLTDDAMHPILPAGSIVAVDRSVTDPRKLHGQIVAARPESVPMIRWLDLSGRHVILPPNQTGRDFPLIPVDFERCRRRAHHRPGGLVLEPLR